ncbi:MAG: histidine kinase [Bacteroidota bacterium]|nr:histidine kinase [Bacteroidota bacterium]
MHPILSDKKKFVIYLFVWSVAAVLLGLIHSSLTGIVYLYTIGFTLPLMLVYAEVNLSAWYLCKAFPIERNSLWKILLVTFISTVLISSMWTVIAWGWMAAIEQFFSISLSPLSLVQTLLVISGIGMPLFFLSLAISYLMSAFEQSRAAERNAFEARLLAQSAELKALRMQIDPHFLFNALNSISALTVSNAESARSMTTTLADFFRKSLSYGAKETISVNEELALLNHYLDIEKIRFGKRLNVVQNIASDTLSCMIPSLLLQPLMENAIKHGISDSIDGGTITISMEKKNSRLFVSVENPIDSDDSIKSKKHGAGMGIEIVSKRLQTLYGNNSGVNISLSNNIFHVVLFLPATS